MAFSREVFRLVATEAGVVGLEEESAETSVKSKQHLTGSATGQEARIFHDGSDNFVELSPREFGGYCLLDSEFGLKVALTAGLVDEHQASFFNEEQKELFNNYGVLRLLGCQVGSSRTRELPKVRELKIDQAEFRVSSLSNKKIPPPITVDHILDKQPHEVTALKDENIFKLVKERKLDFERSLTLTEQEFERLRKKSLEEMQDENNVGVGKYDYRVILWSTKSR